MSIDDPASGKESSVRRLTVFAYRREPHPRRHSRKRLAARMRSSRRKKRSRNAKHPNGRSSARRKHPMRVWT